MLRLSACIFCIAGLFPVAAAGAAAAPLVDEPDTSLILLVGLCLLALVARRSDTMKIPEPPPD